MKPNAGVRPRVAAHCGRRVLSDAASRGPAAPWLRGTEVGQRGASGRSESRDNARPHDEGRQDMYTTKPRTDTHFPRAVSGGLPAARLLVWAGARTRAVQLLPTLRQREPDRDAGGFLSPRRLMPGVRQVEVASGSTDPITTGSRSSCGGAGRANRSRISAASRAVRSPSSCCPRADASRPKPSSEDAVTLGSPSCPPDGQGTSRSGHRPLRARRVPQRNVPPRRARRRPTRGSQAARSRRPPLRSAALAVGQSPSTSASSP